MDARAAFSWLLVGVLAALTWLLIRPFLSWLLATALLAFVFAPVQRRLADRIGSRPAAGALVSLVAVALGALLALGANALLVNGPTVLSELTSAGTLRRLDRLVERRTGLSVPFRPLLRRAVDAATTYLNDRAATLLRASLHALIGFLLSTFVLYYLLKDGAALVGWLRSVTPLPPGVRDELFRATEEMVWAVIKGHVLVAFVQGFVAGLSLVVTGVPHAVTLTLAMMVLALVPVVGVAPVLGGAVVYLLTRGSVLSAVFVVVWGLTVVAVTDDYLRAFFIDRETRIHPATILVGLVGGTYLLGPMGLFVGPILVGLFKAAVDVLGGHYGVVASRDAPQGSGGDR